MTILLVAATPFEIAPTLQWLSGHTEADAEGAFRIEQVTVWPLVTGVGMTATAWRLGAFLAQHRPALALNAGIAGAFDRSLPLGAVVQVASERFGDLGVEEADGRFTDLFELGLAENDGSLFTGGQLLNPGSSLHQGILPAVSGLTVNKVHGTSASIAAICRKYPDVQVESMEGAAFFQVCLSAGVPFMELRGISNYVEPRNREAWNIPLAIRQLNAVLAEMLSVFIPPRP